MLDISELNAIEATINSNKILKSGIKLFAGDKIKIEFGSNIEQKKSFLEKILPDGMLPKPQPLVARVTISNSAGSDSKSVDYDNPKAFAEAFGLHQLDSIFCDADITNGHNSVNLLMAHSQDTLHILKDITEKYQGLIIQMYNGYELCKEKGLDLHERIDSIQMQIDDSCAVFNIVGTKNFGDTLEQQYNFDPMYLFEKLMRHAFKEPEDCLFSELLKQKTNRYIEDCIHWAEHRAREVSHISGLECKVEKNKEQFGFELLKDGFCIYKGQVVDPGEIESKIYHLKTDFSRHVAKEAANEIMQNGVKAEIVYNSNTTQYSFNLDSNRKPFAFNRYDGRGECYGGNIDETCECFLYSHNIIDIKSILNSNHDILEGKDTLENILECLTKAEKKHIEHLSAQYKQSVPEFENFSYSQALQDNNEPVRSESLSTSQSPKQVEFGLQNEE